MVANIAAYMGFMAGKTLLEPVSSIVTSTIDLTLLPTKYDLAQNHPNVMPSPSDLIEGWMNGTIQDQTLASSLLIHGIGWNIQGRNEHEKNANKLWQAVIESKLPKISLDQLIYLRNTEIIDKPTFDKLKKYYGYHADFIDPLMQIMRPRFTEQVVFTEYLRGHKTPDQSEEAVRRLFGCNHKDAEKILKLTQFIPPVGDIIRFAVRDTFNPQLVDKLQLSAEYNENTELKDWGAAQGIGDVEIKTKDGRNITIDMLLKYWQAHWQLPAPTQCYEFLHRLRPDRIPSFGNQVPGLTKFDSDDLNTYLKANDYTPNVRRWLEAISYRVIGRVDLRRLYASDVITGAEVKEQLLDQGYNNRDADYLYDWMSQEKQKQKDKEDEKEKQKLIGPYRNQLIKAYEDGSIDRNTVQSMLASTGMDDEDIFYRLAAIDVSVNRKIVLEYIKQVRSEFYLGGYDGQGAFTNLIEGGVAYERAARYVSLWQRNQTRKRKTANTDLLVKWYSEGKIGFEEINERLSVLGWTGQDRLLLIQGAEEKREALLASQLALDEKNARRAYLEMERAIAKQQAEARAAISRAMAIAPPALLRRQYLKMILTDDEVISRLRYYGWGEQDITNFMDELHLDLAKKEGTPNGE